MSRRSRAIKRERLPDPKFGSPVVTQFVNGLMTGGKKSVAERIFYGAIETIDKKTNGGGIEAFQKALKRVVVKRGQHAESIECVKPDLVFSGKSSRFDVYLV